ncbi:radial spoke 3 [Blastocladiella britannica]|nr:radial spoke 3 [Blastocladiella britannica]
MYDRRIYRGNTYASPVLPAYAQPDAVELQRQQLARRKLRAARRAEAARRPRTPDAIEGRTHMEVQTELYLEELGDTVPEANVATQTDAFLDRAPSPLYIPAKSGIDAATQILEGDLFDFDEEVEPLLEVLVGKTLDRARAEVVQEAELAALRKRQRDFAARRAAEMAEVQRLEQAEVRRVEEKKRRVAEAERLLKEKSEAAKKVAAASFAQVYLSSLVPTTLQGLEEEGFFYDTREREIQQMFLPWLTAQVDQRVLRVSAARSIIDGMCPLLHFIIIIHSTNLKKYILYRTDRRGPQA